MCRIWVVFTGLRGGDIHSHKSSEFPGLHSHLCKECEDKGLTTRCNICGEWRPIVESVSNLEFCKECKETEIDVYRDYTLLLPNSKWLRETLKWIIEARLGDDIATKILNQCDKIGEGKSVSLTITDAHCLHSNLEYCRRYTI